MEKKKGLKDYLYSYAAALGKEAVKLGGSYLAVKALTLSEPIYNAITQSPIATAYVPMLAITATYAGLSAIKALRQKPEFNLNYQIIKNNRKQGRKNSYSNSLRKLLIEDFKVSSEIKKVEGVFYYLGNRVPPQKLDSLLDKKDVSFSIGKEDYLLKLVEGKGVEIRKAGKVEIISSLQGDAFNRWGYIDGMKLGKELETKLKAGDSLIITKFNPKEFKNSEVDVKITLDNGRYKFSIPSKEDFKSATVIKPKEPTNGKTTLKGLLQSLRGEGSAFSKVSRPEIQSVSKGLETKKDAPNLTENKVDFYQPQRTEVTQKRGLKL